MDCTVSCPIKSGVGGDIAHNNRGFLNPSNPRIDIAREKENVTIVSIPQRDAYHQLFDFAVMEYNDQQKRKDRRIKDYFEKKMEESEKSTNPKTGKRTKYTEREMVIQIGEMEDAIGHPEVREIKKKILVEVAKELQDRYTNFKFYNIVVHDDESTPHIHANFVPWADYSTGLKKRMSMEGAQEAMGFKNSRNVKRDIQDDIKKLIAEKIKKLDYENELKIVKKGKSYQYQTAERIAEIRQEAARIANIEIEKDRKEAIEKADKDVQTQIAELQKQKSDAEVRAAEAERIAKAGEKILRKK